MAQMTSVLTYRPARSTDQAFVSNSWCSAVLGPSDQWGRRGIAMNHVIDALLDDERTRVLIACESADEGKIVGWCAHARVPGARVLEFVLVRRQRRGEGIATALLERCELTGVGSPLVYFFDGLALRGGMKIEIEDFI